MDGTSSRLPRAAPVLYWDRDSIDGFGHLFLSTCLFHNQKIKKHRADMEALREQYDQLVKAVALKGTSVYTSGLCAPCACLSTHCAYSYIRVKAIADVWLCTDLLYV